MAVLKGIDVIRRWVIKTRLKEQAKEGGVAITLPKKEFVDLNTSITADRLLRSGVDIDQLTNPNQVDNLINQINKRSVISQDDPRFRGIMEGLMGKKGGVVDMTGKRIPPGSGIMGGRAVDDIPPPGSRGGPEDIAAPVQSSEETLKNMIQAENKKGIAKIKQRKMLEEAIEDASPGFANDIKYDAEIVAENLAERMGLVYDDLPTKQRLDLYDQAYTGLSKKRFKKRPVQRESLEDFVDDAGGVDESDPRGIDDFIPDDDPEPLAKGGIARIGLKDGMNRRTFLKYLAGFASIPIVGKIVKPLKVGKTVSKVPIIKTGDVPGKPEWFDSLVNKVILEGDDVTKNFATKDREIVHLKKIDDETSVRVTQDLDEDTIMVDIDDPVRNVMGEQGDTSLMMRYKKGRADEETRGTPPDEFDITEADMRNYMDGPDDYVTEFVDNTVTNTKDLTSDLTKIKSYATGKSPTMKEIAESKRRRDAVKFAEERPAEYAADRGPQYDYGDEDIELYTDYKKGGLAGMLGE